MARKYDVASVCVKPYAVPMAVEELKGSSVEIGCVIGFPHGNSSIAVKAFEAELACRDGATEIDMVINIGKAPGGEWDYVEKEIKADFDKTSTGYGYVKQSNGDYNYKGATVEDVELLRKYSGPDVQVKCAGGVRTLDDLLKMKAAGATRSGATATEAMLTEAMERFGNG